MYKLDKDLKQFSYKNISDIENKRVIVRSCLNVTVDADGKMIDSVRFYEALPLIKELVQSVKQLVVTAHLGRPETREKKSSFWHVAEVMNQEGVEVELIDDLTEEVLAKLQNPQERQKKVYLLENIRFFKGEESKDKEQRMAFAKQLASLGDVFINDAFPDYREAASTTDIATLLPSYLGPVFSKEVEALSKFNNPEKPFIAVIGGAKLSEKLGALNSLLEIADKVIIGGAMAYTLLKSQGKEIGNSLCEVDKLEVAKEIMSKYADKVVLPVDHLICDTFSEESAKNAQVIDSQEIPNGKIAIDLGPDTIALFKDELTKAKSILWNGPMGVTEWEVSAQGTKAVGEVMAANTAAFVLAGGGDSIAAINKYNLTGFDHISTGGGAMLAFLSYDKFPILDVIVNK